MKRTEANDTTRRLLSVQEMADMLGLSFWTARTLVLNGDIPRVVLPGKTGRTLRRVLIDRKDVEAFIEQSKERGVV